MVVEARKLVDNGDVNSIGTSDDAQQIVDALNALGYDEAAQHVYGMTYNEWKSRHQKKATDEQMERFKASEPLQAKHDKKLLATRGEKPSSHTPRNVQTTATQSSGGSIMSNVCCQDAEQVAASATHDHNTEHKQPSSSSRMDVVGPYTPPHLPILEQTVRVAVLTVSDRASKKEYATGDLSGPAVVAALEHIILISSSSSSPPVQLEILPVEIVPDDSIAIQTKLQQWSSSDNKEAVDIIFTTGGTGMSPRDVTPEATRAVLDIECTGLMTFIATECARIQPLATLTRGTAGIIRPRTLVANLPGNPKAVGEILPLLTPLLLHALQDLRRG